MAIKNAGERRKLTISGKILALNIIKIICDLVAAALGIAAFAYGAHVFQKWWILLFTLIPLGLYASSVIIVEGAPEEEGGEHDGK